MIVCKRIGRRLRVHVKPENERETLRVVKGLPEQKATKFEMPVDLNGRPESPQNRTEQTLPVHASPCGDLQVRLLDLGLHSLFSSGGAAASAGPMEVCTISVDITGLRFFVQSARAGDELTFVREPDNRFDSNAIIVSAPAGSIGYVAKSYAALLAPLLDDRTFNLFLTATAQTSTRGQTYVNCPCSLKLSEPLATAADDARLLHWLASTLDRASIKSPAALREFRERFDDDDGDEPDSQEESVDAPPPLGVSGDGADDGPPALGAPDAADVDSVIDITGIDGDESDDEVQIVFTGSQGAGIDPGEKRSRKEAGEDEGAPKRQKH